MKELQFFEASKKTDARTIFPLLSRTSSNESPSIPFGCLTICMLQGSTLTGMSPSSPAMSPSSPDVSQLSRDVSQLSGTKFSGKNCFGNLEITFPEKT